jgi:ankyrin repeat protein
MMLVTNGADINKRDHDGWTPLHISCSKSLKDLSAMIIVLGKEF